MTTTDDAPTPVTLHDPDVYVEGVPHEFFSWLRPAEPVYWQPEEEGSGYWAVTRHADVISVSRDPETFSSALGTSQLQDFDEETRQKQAAMLLNLDPPEHTRQRLLVSRGFTPRVIARLESDIRRISEDLVDAAVAEGEVDFVEAIAAPLPLAVIAALLGVPREDTGRLYDWSNRMIGFEDPDFHTTEADGEMAAAEIFLYANELAAQRRANPRDDIITALVQPDEDGHMLSEVEFNMFFVLLVIAGNETTRNSATGGMLALIDHPGQWDRLRADPSLAPTAVDEVLRWITPVMDFRRTATRDCMIGDQPVAAGDKVVMFYASANRDEAVFDDPFAFDITRTQNAQLAFGGGGAHYCLGTHLARLELRVLFETLAARVELVERTGPARRLRSNFINGIKEMRVRLHPAWGAPS
ncbi:cytochrome P450 [Tomitella fengzijianii]|uniref:Cytochrome P450 n=1 Tax=Tomitella fengzijianii TaxID=2597660 RepID=A0A516X6H2_9ACTN|nr:cytochrome P450 [Tomitella fengzijianii]QDQ98640.1 cytochrome P450 [Tomitella fengzijianii]